MLPVLIAVARADDPPTSGVIMTVDAYGTPMSGHVVVDADALLSAGIKLFDEQGAARVGKVVPLAHGMIIKGLPQGDRLVQDALDTLMYFDANSDKYLDAADPVFAHLGLFVDKNGDQVAQDGEVKSFGDVGIDNISKFGSIRMKERTTPR